MLIAIALATFFLIGLIVFGSLTAVTGQTARARLLRERLESLNQAGQRGHSEELALLRDDLLSEIPAFHRLLARSSRISRLQLLLSQADIKARAGKFLLYAAASGAFAGVALLTLTRVPIFAMLAAIAGVLLPFGIAGFMRQRRFHRFEELFPEAIELLARAVRAGHSFTTALELIGAELAEPVSGEFRKLYEEQKFGLPVRDALLNLAERMPIMDVKFFVTAVALQRETGGNLAEILDKLSYVIRERFKILRQVRVYTAQGRMTMMLLMALPPGLVTIMLFINRDFITPLFTDSIGHALVAFAVTSQFIGFLLIRKIIRIEV